MHFHRALLEDRFPHGAETCRGGSIDFGRRRRTESRIAAPFKELEIALHHPLRAGGIAFIAELGSCLTAHEGIGIPARSGKLAGNQHQLIIQISGPGIGLESEIAVIDVKFEADLAPGHRPIHRFAIKRADPAVDQRHFTERGIRCGLRTERAPTRPEANFQSHTPRFIGSWPEDHLDPVGIVDLLDFQQPGRFDRQRLSRSANCWKVRDLDARCRQPRTSAGLGRSCQRQFQRGGRAFSSLWSDIDRAGHAATEHRLGAGQNRRRSEQRDRFAENPLHHFGRGNRFTNIKRADHIVSQLGTGQQAALFNTAIEGNGEFLRLAVDFFLRWRAQHGIRDHRAGIGHCRLPV